MKKISNNLIKVFLAGLLIGLLFMPTSPVFADSDYGESEGYDDDDGYSRYSNSANSYNDDGYESSNYRSSYSNSYNDDDRYESSNSGSSYSNSYNDDDGYRSSNSGNTNLINVNSGRTSTNSGYYEDEGFSFFGILNIFSNDDGQNAEVQRQSGTFSFSGFFSNLFGSPTQFPQNSGNVQAPVPTPTTIPTQNTIPQNSQPTTPQNTNGGNVNTQVITIPPTRDPVITTSNNNPNPAPAPTPITPPAPRPTPVVHTSPSY